MRNYNQIFFWGVMLLILGAHLFPMANKFDLVERFLPVMAIAFLITVGCVKGWIFSWWKRVKGRGRAHGASAQALSQGVPKSGTTDGLKAELNNNEAKFKGPDGWLTATLAGFVIWSGLSFIYGDVRTFGFTEIYMLMVGALLFLYFSTVPNIQKWLPYALSVILTVHAIGGIYGFLTTDHGRFFGLFYNPEIKADAWPNAYALMFLLTFPWLIFALFKNGVKKIGAFFMLKTVFIGFLFGTFLAVFSRAGYVAFVIELIFAVVFFRGIIKNNFRSCLVAVTIVCIVGFGVSSSLQKMKSVNFETVDAVERLKFADEGGASSFSERLEFFQGSWELIKAEPFFGYGPASFKWVYPRVQEGFLALSDHPHNWILKLGVERGVPAALFFLMFLAVLFFKTNPFRKNSPLFVRVAWASLAGAMAHSMVDFNFNFISNYLIFWLILAALATQIPQRNVPSKNDIFGLVLAAVLMIALAVSSIQIVKETFWYKSAMRGEIIYTDPFAVWIERKHLIPRWWFLRIAEASAVSAKNSEEFLKLEMNHNYYSAEVYRRLGEVYTAKGNYLGARSWYKMAIDSNPKNTFRYYLGYVEASQKLGDAEAIEEIRPNIEALIEEYIPLYEKNLHFTQRDGEMQYVDELRDLLAR